MKSYTMLAAPLLLCGLAACNGTPTNGLIPGSTYQLEELNKARPVGTPFTQALTANYRVLAQAERDEYDWNSSQMFAKKGLVAAQGRVPLPERLDDWYIADKAAEHDLRIARGRLMTMLDSDAQTWAPQWSANALTNFDCWIQEQNEGWQMDEIAACRGAFMTHMQQISAGPRMGASQPAPAKEMTPSTKPTNYLIFFDFDKADLLPEARGIIASALKAINAEPQGMIKVTGYTDTSGTSSYNDKLSARRGNAVEQALLRGGIAADRISVDSRGESDLFVKTPDGVREPQNRRATIELMGK